MSAQGSLGSRKAEEGEGKIIEREEQISGTWPCRRPTLIALQGRGFRRASDNDTPRVVVCPVPLLEVGPPLTLTGYYCALCLLSCPIAFVWPLVQCPLIWYKFLYSCYTTMLAEDIFVLSPVSNKFRIYIRFNCRSRK